VTPEFTFPANADKTPRCADWRKAFQGVAWAQAELVGAPTGERNGFDVLDVDPRGVGWFDANFDALPATHAQETPRGLHLYFRHAPGLRCSASRIAPGVDVRAEGGYVILWRREGLPFEEHPLCEWPEWLLKEAKGADRLEGYPRQKKTLRDDASQFGKCDPGSYLDALRKMDPREWRGDFEAWFALLTAAKAVGVGREEFADWSVGDVKYADRRAEIERIWDCARGEHGRALYAALSERGIKLSAKRFLSRVPISAEPARRGNLQSRTHGLITWLSRHATADGLFSAACLFAEIGFREDVAIKLIDGNLPTLRRALGDAEFTRAITNAFARVTNKLKEPQS
jgi:Bifunctional DNA primase/polymerase, N-terminal